MQALKTIIRKVAHRTGRLRNTYIRICKPDNFEHAAFLKRWGGFQHIGERTTITLGVKVTDPAYVSIGNNCGISECTLIGHNGAVRVFENAYGVKMDAVGKTVIEDDCFIGHSAIILPGVTIGRGAVVGAGAVVSRDVAPGTVVAGNPAREVGQVADLVARMLNKSEQFPWHQLVVNRGSRVDPASEATLVQLRVAHWYGSAA